MSAELGRRVDLAVGVAVANPMPGISRKRPLAAEVLLALGKRFDALERESAGLNGEGFREQEWSLARLWLRAERIRHLVILSADRLARDLWGVLITLATDLQLVLWLVVSARVADYRLRLVSAQSIWSSNDLLATLPRQVAGEDMPSSEQGSERIRRLRQIVSPACACALTLAEVSGYDPCALAGLDRGSLGVSGRTLNLNGRSYAVPGYAAALVRAQLIARRRRQLFEGASWGMHAADALFIDRRGMRTDPCQLAWWMRHATGKAVCHNPLLNLPSLDRPALVRN